MKLPDSNQFRSFLENIILEDLLFVELQTKKKKTERKTSSLV